MFSCRYTVLMVGMALVCLVSPAESRRRYFRECREERLKNKESTADVILNGIVKRVYSAHEGLYGGEVLVKRLIKGESIKAGESLIVFGFGNQDFCGSNITARDSRIFFLTQLETGRFQLSSSPLRINVQNLDKVAATVKGIPYRRRTPVVEEPCERKYCSVNGDCYDENRRIGCRCPSSCKEHYNPVCGSDGLTYNTECQLRVESCRNKKKIYVLHEGLCKPQ